MNITEEVKRPGRNCRPVAPVLYNTYGVVVVLDPRLCRYRRPTLQL